jgi:phosphoribosylformylglycinamidine cyclo-ligase
MGITYKDAGVDVEAGNSFVKKIGPIVKSTFSKEVLTDIGGFGALYSGSFPGMTEPVLVSGTDGVGTKLKIAQMMNRHDTIGIDAVAMCVNDTLVSGARPLFFLDYLSCGKLREDVMVDIVKGLAEGCRQAGCSLVGGETAEHPGIIPDDDYDIGAFAVGVVDRPKIIDGKSIKPGDKIIGLHSSGVHSNGFSMVRKLFFDILKIKLDQHIDELGGTLGNTLITPTRIYCKQVLGAIEQGAAVKGMVHITGGGFYENIPRILPEGCGVTIKKDSYPIPPIFTFMQTKGKISEREMYTTFNMGIGLMIFVAENDVKNAMEKLAAAGEKPVVIGEVVGSVKKDVVLI